MTEKKFGDLAFGGPGLENGGQILRKKEKAPICSMERWKKIITSKLPIIKWLPSYNREFAVADAIAGITVGLTVIPQGIAYAIVAGLPPQYGLYSAFMGCFAYCIFGSSKDITIGPTAIMALMTGAHAKLGPDYAVLLAFLSGIIILACGLLRLGFLIDFISVPVIAGFTSAAAITIASGQVKSLLGLTIHPEHKSHLHLGVVDGWIDVFKNISTCRWADATLGLICSAILIGLKYLGRSKYAKQDPDVKDKKTQVLRKVVWVVCTARNAIVVIFCLVLAAGIDPNCPNLEENTNCTFKITGKIQPGLPALQAPPFSLEGPDPTSSDDDQSFGGMLAQLGSAIIIIPLIAILESVAIAKAFAAGKPVDASQEMIALGFCNILGSFVQAMPTTGSFSRTAVNSSSGVRTPMGGIYTGALVIVCLALLMPYCAYIPKASLAAVIITAVISSVEYEVVKPMWNSKKTDLLPGFACFLGCLFYELELGIGLGILIQVLMVLYRTARPGLLVEVKKVAATNKSYICVTPAQTVVFPSVSHIRQEISKVGLRQDTLMPIVIDCCHMDQVDFTAAEGFHAMIKDLESRGQEVFWLNSTPSVASTISSIAGDHFRPISGPHQVLEDERDRGEDEKLLGNERTEV